ncbi:MAG: CCA tRNA nucleotidyltransferase [Deltaproteobacteria bacterium]|nr:CCA tRNA nucleotidyltransferase [Deltaproteobacteria bacterium]
MTTISKTIHRIASERFAIKRLKRWLPPNVSQVIKVLHKAGGQAFLVGGAVRDVFLGRRTNDWDIATNLLPSQVASLFSKVVRAGEKHGTIMVIIDGEPIEVTTFRRDGAYLDQRRPAAVEFHTNINEDLTRRDFTINAIAADLINERIIDPFAGVADLRKGVVRCVGDPSTRFNEDGLRILRAVRFAGVLSFRIEKTTRAAIPKAINTFLAVSWERKRDEMSRLLAAAPFFSACIRELWHTGLLKELAPELMTIQPTRLKAIDNIKANQPWQRFTAWAMLANLTPNIAGEILRRWRAGNQVIREVEQNLKALNLLTDNSPPKGYSLRCWLSQIDAATAKTSAKIAACIWHSYHEFPRRTQRAINRNLPLKISQLAITGNDLVAAGFVGREVGETLTQILEFVIKHPQLNKRNQLITFAHRLSTGKT